MSSNIVNIPLKASSWRKLLRFVRVSSRRIRTRQDLSWWLRDLAPSVLSLRNNDPEVIWRVSSRDILWKNQPAGRTKVRAIARRHFRGPSCFSPWLASRHVTSCRGEPFRGPFHLGWLTLSVAYTSIHVKVIF